MNDARQMIQILLVTGMVLWFPIANWSRKRQLQRFTSAAARLALYRKAILGTAVPAFAAMLVSMPNNLFVVQFSKADIPWLLDGPVQAAAIAVTAGFFVLYAAQILYLATNAARRRKAVKLLNSMKYMLPVSDRERRWFALVGTNAGISEEILYRGFLLQFLHGKLTVHTGMSLTSALLTSALLFGLGHLYQGVGGIAKTAVFGWIAGLMTIMTGSLLWPITLHALIDLAVLLVYRPQIDSPDEAQSLIQGHGPDIKAASVPPER